MLSDTQADCAALPLTPGNRVSVVVLEVDYSRGDVLVGQKQLRFAEWEETARSRYFVGQDVKVRVKRICKDVALVSLDNGFEGVLPSVHLQWAEDAGVALPFLPPQPEVDAEVVAIDFANQSIVLSRSKAIQAELERRDKLLSEFTVGEVRKGIVKKIADFGAFIELEPGVNGMIHVTEMSWRRVAPHPREILNIGQEIEVSVLQINHEKRHVSLSLKRLVGDPWTGIEAKFPVGTKVKGKVLKLVAYGAVIELEPGVNGLVHVTELSWTMRITKPDEVLKLGQEIDAVVLAVNREEEKIALGVRQLTFNPWEQARGKYPHGTSIKGKVQSLARYGAFVEFGDGLYGLIHVSNISWTRTIKHSSKAFQVGDEVEVMILSVDPVKQRISMGVKQLTNDPWLTISDYFKIGTLVTGKVVETCGIGASLLLPGGFHGLIHKSEIPLDAGKSVSDFLAIGQDVMARVKALDTGKRRIGLSLKL